MAWKKYAQTGEFYSKEFSKPGADPEWVDYAAFQVSDTELRLSYMCDQILSLDKSGASYGLKLPGQRIKPKIGGNHLSECLTALALFKS